MELALLVLRLVVGGIFVAHGAQKLFAAFGGPGISGFAGILEHLGMRPAKHHAYVAGAAEFGGGILIALGLLTPLGTAAITAVMLVAIAKVHFANGFFITNQGYEFNLVLIAAVFALAGVGAGDWSLDHALSLDVAGTGWALGALGAGVLGALGAVTSSRVLERREHPPTGTATGAA
jgi:putative oxidoreductase